MLSRAPQELATRPPRAIITVMIRGLYEVDEVAQLVGLSPRTVRIYATRTTLVRGRDFLTLRRVRFGRYQNRLLFTRRGVDRLAQRDFVRLDRAQRPGHPDIIRWAKECEAVNPGSPRRRDGKDRRRQLRIARLAFYLITHPCIVRGCICACHHVGGPDNQGYPRVDSASETPASQD
jgi:hypothetical protein